MEFLLRFILGDKVDSKPHTLLDQGPRSRCITCKKYREYVGILLRRAEIAYQKAQQGARVVALRGGDFND